MMNQIRQYIPYPRVPAHCAECSIELAANRHSLYPRLCDVCAEMLLAVARPYFIRLHHRYVMDLQHDARHKQEMMNGDSGGTETED